MAEVGRRSVRRNVAITRLEDSNAKVREEALA
jgi:hypothetical protein